MSILNSLAEVAAVVEVTAVVEVKVVVGVVVVRDVAAGVVVVVDAEPPLQAARRDPVAPIPAMPLVMAKRNRRRLISVAGGP
jgi:hypothetical protein